MPYLNFRETPTPLRLVGIKFFKETESNEVYVKIGKRHRHRLFSFLRKKAK